MNKTGQITENDWNTKLISAVHMGCVMGWDNKGTNQAINDFALATVNEVMCGVLLNAEPVLGDTLDGSFIVVQSEKYARSTLWC